MPNSFVLPYGPWRPPKEGDAEANFQEPPGEHNKQELAGLAWRLALQLALGVRVPSDAPMVT